MKKLLKTLTKKSIALLMTVMMLMSCWVFVAPIPEAHAAQETLDYTLQQLKDTYLTTDSGATFVKGKFTNDNTVPAQDGLYVNVLYSPAYTQTDIYSGVASGSSKLGVDGCNSSNYNSMDVDWHHAETVMLYDGVNTPRTGVMVTTDPNKGGSWDGTSTVERVWMTNSNLAHPSYWKGICGANLDFTWAMTQGDQLNYLSTTTDSSKKITRKNSETVPVYGNYMQYTGSMDKSKFLEEIKPSFSLYVYDDKTNATISATSNTYVRVVNYKSLKEAIANAQTYVNEAVANPTKYTEASKEQLRVLANALVAAKPDSTYFNGNSKCDYTNYAKDAKAAVDAWWNFGGLVTASYTVTFVDAQGTVKTETVESGKNATAPTARAKAYDANYHYSFSNWDKAYTNITGPLTVTAVYTATPHSFTGEVKYNNDGTHSWKCTGCEAYGIKDGNAGQVSNCTFPDEWSYDGTEHSKKCSVCNGVDSHTVKWINSTNYIKSAATCVTNKDVYYQECETCGVSSEKYAPDKVYEVAHQIAHARVEKKDEYKAPTCDADGLQVFWCPACGGQREEITIPGGHKLEEKVNKEGDIVYHYWKCSVCNNVVEEGKEKHTWNLIFATDPTCTEDSVGLYFCDGCGYEVESIYTIDANGYFTTTLIAPKLDHKNADGTSAYEFLEAGVEATCSTTGNHTEMCSLCYDVITVTDPINPNNHKYSAAQSNNDGTHKAVCEYNSAHVITDPCSDEDKNCVCDTCGYNIPHEYDEEVIADKYIATPATCTVDATYYRSCQCGHFEANADNTFVAAKTALGHDYTEESDAIRSAATCTEAQTNWYGCSRCDANAKDDANATDKYYSVGTPLGHEATNVLISVTDKTHGFKCVRYDDCNTAVNITDCTFENYTDNNNGTHTATCACGNTLTESHKLTDKWTSDNAEGTQAGTHSKYCTLCDYVETDDCNYESEVFEATCLAPKHTEYVCTVCGHGYTVYEGTKLDHSYTGEYEIDAENDQHRQLCVNGCNEYGEWTACELDYTNTGAGTHHAECICGNAYDDTCSGGEATCTHLAVCQYCNTAYGDYAPHNFAGAARNEGEGKHSYNCTTDGCGAYGVGTTEGATEDCYGGTAYCDAKKVCEACNTAYGEFDLNNHRETVDMPGLDPTCMSAGYTAYKQCVNDKCNAILGKETIPVNPDAHKWNTEAHSTNDGKHYYACEYNADHKNVIGCFCSDPVVKAPTCEEDGYTLHTCDECGYQWTTDPTTAIGHDYGEWITDENKTGHYRVCKNDKKHIETGVCAESATAVVTNPTCTEQGYTTYTCTECGNVWKDNYTDPTGHTYTQKIIDDAHLFTTADYEATGVTTNTCERADYYWFDCKDCDKNGKVEEDTTKYPLASRYYQNGKGEGHTWKGKSVTEYAILATPATCDKNATYYVYCTACHMTSKDIEGVEATFEAWGTAISHDYQNIVDENDLTKNRVSAATCTAKAVYYKSCANCGEVNDEATFTYGEMTAHKYTEKVSDISHMITEANCTTVATYWYDCEYCNSNAGLIDKTAMTEEAIAALQYTDGLTNPNNHGKLTRVPYKAPTCNEDGHSEYRVCSLCKKEIGKITAGYEKKTHSFKGEYVVVNVVDGEGNITAYKHKRACEYGCGTYSEPVECGFSAWKQNADGKTHSMACACGNKITKDCVANSNASCNEAATCKDCGGTVGTVSGHDWDEWKSNGDGKTHSRVCKTNSKHVETANCGGGVASGCGAIYCSVCNQQYATGVDHDWGDWVDTQAATCNTPAKHKRACQKCSATEEESYGAALGHDYDKDNDGINDYVVTKEATCTEAGIKTYTCLNGCGDTYTEVIKALGHELAKEWTITLEPTCNAEGTKIKKCVHTWKDADGKTVECDYYEERTIPADKSKHVPGDWVPAEGASNCITGLKSYKYCTVCGKCVDEKIEQISHDWRADVIVYGTCTANGYIKMVCDKCGSAKTFDENTPGFPNKLDDTVIDGATASKLLSKGGHKWATTPTGDAEYVIQNGCVIYVKTAATCSKLGTGYMVCTADGCTETKTVSINKTEHNFKTMPASAATCQTPGHTEYLACRNCSYTTESTTIPKLGHVDTDGSGKCDRCGFQMYTPDNGGTAACGCMCHDSSFFIAKIIYPIARFFWKLFKTNKSCSCGNVHY